MTTPANPLSDLIPAAYRKTVYALAALAALVYSVWQASQGDWKTFVGGLFATLVPLLAASNTPTSVPAVLDEVEDVADETDVEVDVDAVVEGIMVDNHDGHASA